DHTTPAAMDLVDRPRVAGRDEEVPVVIESDRIHVEVVEGARSLRLVRLVDSDLLQAAPLEEHPPGGEIELLHDAVVGPAPLRPAGPRQARRDRIVGRHEGGAFGGEQELVEVGPELVTGREAGDLTVRLVDDDRLPQLPDAPGITPPP